jgi:hypothetical protein
MRKKYEPTQKDLRIAWRLKRKGKTINEIIKRLKIGYGQYERSRSKFNAYFEQQKKAEKFKSSTQGRSKTRKAPTKTSPNYKKGEKKLNPEDIDLDVLRSYVICGFNRDRIAGLLGISRGTLHLITKESEDIRDVLNKASDELAADVLRNGLLMLSKEHTVKDTHFASYQGDIYSREYNKRFRPHLGAIKYILANTIGWQSETKPQAPNNKGAILRMMDEIANHEDGVGCEDIDQSESTPT